MQYIIDFCYDTFVRKKIPVKKQSPRCSPPSSPKKTKIYNCCNFICFNNTEKLREWKHVKIGLKRYYFCNDDCWNEWLKNPNQIGSWSPGVLSQEQIHDIESIQLNSPISQCNFKEQYLVEGAT